MTVSVAASHEAAENRDMVSYLARCAVQASSGGLQFTQPNRNSSERQQSGTLRDSSPAGKL